MTKGQAAILEELNKPLVVAEIEIPKPSFGQVLVQIKSSGICGRQLGEIAGEKGPDKFLPHLLGHEGGGIVLEVGAGVTKVKPGDHVVLHWRKAPGIESEFPKYQLKNGKQVGGGLVTTFADHALASENRLTPVSKELPFEIAALLGCAVTTALGLINNEAQLKIGQSIAILGCGGVGLNVIQGAHLVSANPIIAVDIFDRKLSKAQEFGATHLINSKTQDLVGAIQSIVGKKGVDVIVDCTGQVELIEKAYQLTAPGGRTILVGQPRFDKDLKLRGMAQHFTGKMLFDSQGGMTNPAEDIPRYTGLYLAGRLPLDKLVSHRFPLNEVNTAIEKIRAGEATKCVLTMA